MGIRISQPSERAREQPSRTQCLTQSRESPTALLKANEPQRNDNATKLINPEQRVPFASDYLSSSTGSTVSSRPGPQLGSSPISEAHSLPHPPRDIQQVDQYWLERNLLPEAMCLAGTVCKKPSRIRPPWKPSVVKTHYKYESPGRMFVTNTNHACNPNSHQNHIVRRLAQSHQNESRGSRPRRRRGSPASLACLYDIRLQTSEAHLRRCSAAREVWAKRTDELDTMSSNTHTPRVTISGYQQRKSQRPTAFRSVYCQTTLRRNRLWKSSNISLWRGGRIYRRKVSAASIEPVSAALSSDSSMEHESVRPFSTVHDDSFPLRYVFYVEDVPSSVRAFANAGKVSVLARDTRCRVYFHAQIQRPASTGRVLGQTDSTHESPTTVQPALYYQGKRVRPVTVAAPDLASLLRFVKLLDVHYPEFGASAFLTDQLISSGKPGKETEQGNARSE